MKINFNRSFALLARTSDGLVVPNYGRSPPITIYASWKTEGQEGDNKQKREGFV